MASPDHQVGGLFEALDEGVLMAPSKFIGYFFAISTFPEVRVPVGVLLPPSIIGKCVWLLLFVHFVFYGFFFKAHIYRQVPIVRGEEAPAAQAEGAARKTAKEHQADSASRRSFRLASAQWVTFEFSGFFKESEG